MDLERKITNKSKLEIALMLLATAAILALTHYDGFLDGCTEEKEKFQREAIIQGFAEYRTDKEGRAIWVWKSE